MQVAVRRTESYADSLRDSAKEAKEAKKAQQTEKAESDAAEMPANGGLFANAKISADALKKLTEED